MTRKKNLRLVLPFLAAIPASSLGGTGDDPARSKQYLLVDANLLCTLGQSGATDAGMTEAMDRLKANGGILLTGKLGPWSGNPCELAKSRQGDSSRIQFVLDNWITKNSPPVYLAEAGHALLQFNKCSEGWEYLGALERIENRARNGGLLHPEALWLYSELSALQEQKASGFLSAWADAPEAAFCYGSHLYSDLSAANRAYILSAIHIETSSSKGAFNQDRVEMMRAIWKGYLDAGGSDYFALLTANGFDEDRDGFLAFQLDPSRSGEMDCDDKRKDVNPGAKEIMGNGIDDNCDGKNEGKPADNDGDRYFGSPTDGSKPDCDDKDAKTYPGAVDKPGDGKDQDCDGKDTPLVDSDGDRYFGNDPNMRVKDCDDANPSVHPRAAEIPGNGVDEDCDGKDVPAPVAVATTTPERGHYRTAMFGGDTAVQSYVAESARKGSRSQIGRGHATYTRSVRWDPWEIGFLSTGAIGYTNWLWYSEGEKESNSIYEYDLLVGLGPQVFYLRDLSESTTFRIGVEDSFAVRALLFNGEKPGGRDIVNRTKDSLYIGMEPALLAGLDFHRGTFAFPVAVSLSCGMWIGSLINSADNWSGDLLPWCQPGPTWLSVGIRAGVVWSASPQASAPSQTVNAPR